MVKQKPVEKISIPPEKTEGILNELRRISKLEIYKIAKLLNDSTLSKFATKKGSK